MLRIYVLAYLVFLYAPVVLLPIFAFNDSTVIAFPLDGFTLRWFVGLTETEALHAATLNSLSIAVTTATIATILGLMTARAMSRFRFPGQKAMYSLIMVPLVLPEIIIGVALLVVMVTFLGIPLSNWTVIAGHTLICTPFAVAILTAAFQNIDPSLEEAAVDLGYGRVAAFRKIVLPLIGPGMVAAFLISFIISLDEFIIAFFLTGANPTLPVYIWGQLRFPTQLPVVFALGTLLILLSVLLLSIAEMYRRRGVAKAGRQDTGGFL